MARTASLKLLQRGATFLITTDAGTASHAALVRATGVIVVHACCGSAGISWMICTGTNFSSPLANCCFIVSPIGIGKPGPSLTADL